MEELFHKTAQQQPQKRHRIITESKRVVSELYVLKPSADKEAKRLAGKAKGFLVFCLVVVYIITFS